jgi:hypothetical protein
VLIAETYRQLMTDPAHWEFELSLEALTFVAGAIFARIYHPIRRHDRKHHGGDGSMTEGTDN